MKYLNFYNIYGKYLIKREREKLNFLTTLSKMFLSREKMGVMQFKIKILISTYIENGLG